MCQVLVSAVGKINRRIGSTGMAALCFNGVLLKEPSDRKHLSRDLEIVNHMHLREEEAANGRSLAGTEKAGGRYKDIKSERRVL